MKKQRWLRCGLTVALTLAPVMGVRAQTPDVAAQVQARLKPGQQLEPPIIDSSEVMAGTHVYFASSTITHRDSKGGTYDETFIDAYLLFADKEGHWHDVWFDRYPEDGGVPQVASVFFAHADHDPHGKELIVLMQTPQRHYDYSGDFYDAYVYKITGAPYAGAVFVALQADASAPFQGQCDCSSRDGGKSGNGKDSVAPYKTAGQIRKALAAKYPVVKGPAVKDGK